MWIIPRNHKLANDVSYVPYQPREEARALNTAGVWHRQENNPRNGIYGKSVEYWARFLVNKKNTWVDNIRGRLCAENAKFTRLLVEDLEGHKPRSPRRQSIFRELGASTPRQVHFRQLSTEGWKSWAKDNIFARHSQAVKAFNQERPCHIAFFFQTAYHGQGDIWTGEITLSSALRFHSSFENSIILIDLKPCDTSSSRRSRTVEPLDEIALTFRDKQKLWSTPLASADTRVSPKIKQSILSGEKLSYGGAAHLKKILGPYGEEMDQYFINPRFLEAVMGLPINLTRPSASTLEYTITVKDSCENFTQGTKYFFSTFNINFT